MADREQLETILQEVTAPNVSHERVMEIYTEWADMYDKGIKSPDYLGPQKIAQLVAEVLGDRKEARIIDLGAGTGLCAEELLKIGFPNIDALDASRAMLDVARNKGIYKNLICDMLGPNKLKIEDDTYDVATIVGTFTPGHVNGSCLDEIARIIKPGGYFVGVIGKRYLTTCDDLKDLESDMQRIEDAGVWKRIIRRVESYHVSDDGVFFVFQILPQ